MPDRGGQREEALYDAHVDALLAASVVFFLAELAPWSLEDWLHGPIFQ